MILDMQGGFKTEERGGVEVKGKGLMQTFWLIEEKGKELPPSKWLCSPKKSWKRSPILVIQ